MRMNTTKDMSCSDGQIHVYFVLIYKLFVLNKQALIFLVSY